MIDFLVFVLAAMGMGHIIADGIIMTPFKTWLQTHKWTWLLEGMNCYQCAGTWSGFVIIVLMWLSRTYPELFWLDFIVYAFVGSISSTIGAVIIGYFNLLINGMEKR